MPIPGDTPSSFRQGVQNDTAQLNQLAAQVRRAVAFAEPPLQITDTPGGSSIRDTREPERVARLDDKDETAEVTLTASGSVTGGTYTLTVDPDTTAAIAFDATADEVKAALEAIEAVGPGGVSVGGGPFPGAPLTLSFAPGYEWPEVTVDASALTGGGSAAVTQTGADRWGWTEMLGRADGEVVEKPGGMVTTPFSKYAVPVVGGVGGGTVGVVRPKGDYYEFVPAGMAELSLEVAWPPTITSVVIGFNEVCQDEDLYTIPDPGLYMLVLNLCIYTLSGDPLPLIATLYEVAYTDGPAAGSAEFIGPGADNDNLSGFAPSARKAIWRYSEPNAYPAARTITTFVRTTTADVRLGLYVITSGDFQVEGLAFDRTYQTSLTVVRLG